MAALGHMLGLISCHGAGGGAVTPDVPTGFAAVPGAFEIAQLSWDLVPGTTTRIYVDGSLFDTVPNGISDYSFIGTPAGSIYDFQISAVSTISGLESGLTAVISCATGLGFTGVLDGFTASLVVCWNLQLRLLSSYTGYAFLARADRTGQPTMDIPFKTDGTLDTDALLAFAGSDSVYVVTAYAQFGSNDFTESSAAAQPRIVNAGVLEIGGAFWNGGQDLAAGTVVFPDATKRQVCTQVRLTTGEGGGMWNHIGSASVTGDYVNAFGGVYSDLPETDARVVSATLSLDVDHVLSEERDGSNAAVRVDGTVTASRADATGDMSVSGYMAIGNRQGNAFVGHISGQCQWSDTTDAAGRAAALA